MSGWSVFQLGGMAAKLRDMLFRGEDAGLRELVAKTGDDEVLHVIDGLPPKEKRRVFRQLSPERQSRILIKISEYSQKAIVPSLGVAEISAMIGMVESDEAVDVIQVLGPVSRARIIADLRKHDPHGLLPLLVFDEQTAGGRMKTELHKFQASSTVDDARKVLAAPGKLKSHFLYVVDEHETLLGVIAPLRLLQATGTATLSEVMQVPPATLPAAMDQEEVVKVFDEHNALELPVVNPKGKVLGCITADDIFEVMEEEYAEDVSRLVGIDQDDRISDPILLTVRRRLPWLLVNLGTAVLAASVVGLFQDTIQRLVMLAAFMPIIAGMGGNAGTQTLGVMVRAIALDEMKHVHTAHAIAKQVAAGTLNGFVNGLVMGGVAYVWTNNLTLSFVILVAMTANLFVAGLGGVIVPVVMKSLRIDPALASTVFVTTLTDICGFFVFLGLATVML